MDANLVPVLELVSVGLVLVNFIIFASGVMYVDQVGHSDALISTKYHIGFLRVTAWPRLQFIKWSCRRYLRRVPDTSYVTGHKWAYLTIQPDGQLAFLPWRPRLYRYMRHWPSYGAVATAHCRGQNTIWKSHQLTYCREVPDLHHKCGFHALIRPQHLGRVHGAYYDPRLQWRAAVVTLQVDLSNRVIPGSIGYRAQHQRVLKVSIGPRCAVCLDAGHVRFVPRTAGLARLVYTTFWHEQHTMVVPACRRHAEADLSLSLVASQLGTEVAYA